MAKKKNKRDESVSNMLFELGIAVALSPINMFLRSLGYYLGVGLSILSIFLWTLPVVIFFSLISNTIFTLEILYKLIRKDR